MHTTQTSESQHSRRAFLEHSGLGLGITALGSLLNHRQSCPASESTSPTDHWRGILTQRHQAPRAKRVIHLCMAGGPSHLETLDFKPTLAKEDGKLMPSSLTKGKQIAQLQGAELRCLGPQHVFQKHGQSQQEISAALPHLGTIADKICIIRSVQTQQINHDPAHTLMNTGSGIPGRPSMGSWILYGLGSETANLPGYVVLTSVGGGQSQPIAARQWHSGFLPSRFQGVPFRSSGDPVLYVNRPEGVTQRSQAQMIDAVKSLNQMRNQVLDDPELTTRISQYEMAFRMQTSVPELMDISDEPDHVLEMYGLNHLENNKGGDGSFASNCLLARRLAERGVRFIQLYHRGWDHHSNIKNGVQFTANLVDRGCAALVNDLSQRGMLDETLVIWGGEFGRTPMAQGNGRDHHIMGFSMWMAGAGIKNGFSWGATDDFGYQAIENVVSVHDLHATLLHLLGVEHKQLTYRFQGRDYRLTDVHGKVIHNILS